MRVFPVLEVELSTISYMNTLSTLCLSIGGYFFDKVLNLEIPTIQYRSPFFYISVACFVIGIVSMAIRFLAIHKIKKQTPKTIRL